MEKYQEQLVSLLSYELFQAPTNVVSSEELMSEARLQTVSSLISNSEYQILARNIRVIAAHAQLTEVLDNIPFVTIKGYASAHFYPHPERRTMGDVDIYVSGNEYSKASDALIKAGYTRLSGNHERHEEFRKDNICFELHSEIKGIPNGLDGIKTSSTTAESKVRFYLSDIIETAERIQTSYGVIVIPDEFHHGLIMLLHIAGHMLNDGGIGIRHLCDWAVYVEKNDVNKYRNQFIDMGLWIFACQLTNVCEKHLGLKKQTWSGKWEDDVIDFLFEDIIAGGNFGRKVKYRNVSNRISNDSNRLSAIVHLTQNKYPITTRHPILLPGAIIVWGTCYFAECISGKRKLIKYNDLKEGKNRIKLYSKFKLFEYEENI